MAAKTNEPNSSLISNENENENPPAQPMSPKQRETTERMASDPRVPEIVKLQARMHLARDDAMRAKAGGCTMTTRPKPIEPAELKARTAALMTKSKASPETIVLLEGLGPGCDPHQVDLCVRRLCRELDGDGRSQGYFVDKLNAVRRGEIPAEAIVHAYVRAGGPRLRNRGAAFVAAVKQAQAGAPRP
jgi:hypothetical protein